MLLCDICREDITNSFGVYNTNDPLKQEPKKLCMTCFKYYQRLYSKARVISWQLTKKKYGKETVTK